MIYLVPSDEPIRTDYIIAMQNAILHVQAFYLAQTMNGHSFSVRSPVVEVHRTNHTSEFYSTGENAHTFGFWNNLLTDGFSLTGGGFNDPNNRWIFYLDSPVGCGQFGGGAAGGVVGLAQHDLRGLTGQSNIPACSNQSPDPRGVCRYVGGLGHEVGHAFTLPHPPGCDQGDQTMCGELQFNSLMYLGYSFFPNTYLLDQDRVSLMSTGFFAPFNLATPGASFCSSMTAQSPNPIDRPDYFVRWNYKDFLTREPDALGSSFWTEQIASCGTDPGCTEVKRIDTSAAFFLSIEFQESGFLVYRAHTASFGPNRVGGTVPLTLREFLPDTQQIARGVIVGDGDWQAQIEANKQAYFVGFVQRPTFEALYPDAMTAAAFVDTLNANTGGALSHAERDTLVAGLETGAETRASALRAVTEDADLRDQEVSRAFVLMQYFGYLQRNPNEGPETDFSGYNFWLAKLNQFSGDFRRAEMVKAFITSQEYRERFGQP